MTTAQLQPMVDEAIREVLENIVDPNTEATAKRSVTLTIKLNPDKERSTLGIELGVKTSFAPRETIGAMAFISHTRDGVVAVENDPGQRNLYEEDDETDTPVVDIKTGRGNE